MHGWSAGLGKLGAAVGAFLYPVLQNSSDRGLETIMGLQVVVCLCGYACNELFIVWPPAHLAAQTNQLTAHQPEDRRNRNARDVELGAVE